MATIDTAIHTIFKHCPHVLVDLTTGKLCDAQERIRIFKSEISYKRLVSEAVTKNAGDDHILHAVAKYFEWVMFSHTWEGTEPTFQDVNLVNSIWNLDKSPLNVKLQQFCNTARKDGHRWVWSDTCCIDKSTNAILSQTLISMYTWYAEAAATLVYLADVLPSSGPGSLAKSRWMTRAWTLQELLASKIIRFYDRNWKPYLNDTSTNHKDSFAIKEELARAIGVIPETIVSFQPEYLGVREKLRLASMRDATKDEDIAYSLIGIFSSDIVPRYGLGKTALGHLLEDIVARSGDLTVIAWTGKPSSYNSALPVSLAAYSQTPYSAPSMGISELSIRIEQLRNRLSREDCLAFYDQVIKLPRATFSHRCLQLPCIVFSVTKIDVQASSGCLWNLHCATVPLLGLVEFRSADMILREARKFVFVHPWLRDLRDFAHEPVSDEESEGKSSSPDTPTPTPPLYADPPSRPEDYTQALRLIARLEHPFTALLLEQQSTYQYKRVAAEYEIIVPAPRYQAKTKDIGVRVLEII